MNNYQNRNALILSTEEVNSLLAKWAKDVYGDGITAEREDRMAEADSFDIRITGKGVELKKDEKFKQLIDAMGKEYPYMIPWEWVEFENNSMTLGRHVARDILCEYLEKETGQEFECFYQYPTYEMPGIMPLHAYILAVGKAKTAKVPAETPATPAKSLEERLAEVIGDERIEGLSGVVVGIDRGSFAFPMVSKQVAAAAAMAKLCDNSGEAFTAFTHRIADDGCAEAMEIDPRTLPGVTAFGKSDSVSLLKNAFREAAETGAKTVVLATSFSDTADDKKVAAKLNKLIREALKDGIKVAALVSPYADPVHPERKAVIPTALSKTRFLTQEESLPNGVNKAAANIETAKSVAMELLKG